jgi:hypothetical protein
LKTRDEREMSHKHSDLLRRLREAPIKGNDHVFERIGLPTHNIGESQVKCHYGLEDESMTLQEVNTLREH